MSANYQALKLFRKKIRSRLMSGFGSVCGICDFPHTESLDFHHLDPSEKEFTLAGWKSAGGWVKLAEEVKKCVLLCANCHRRVHAGTVCIPSDIKRFDESVASFVEDAKIISINKCKTCESEMPQSKAKYCSVKCRPQMPGRPNIDWDSPKILEIIRSAGSIDKAAATIGASGVAISKQMKKRYPELFLKTGRSRWS